MSKIGVFLAKNLKKYQKIGENVGKCLEYRKMDFTIVFPTSKNIYNPKSGHSKVN